MTNAAHAPMPSAYLPLVGVEAVISTPPLPKARFKGTRQGEGVRFFEKRLTQWNRAINS